MKTQSTFVAAFFFATILPSAALAQSAQAGIPLKVVTGKPVVDGVFLNGHGPYRFLLDTGSQSNQLDSGLARRLGLAATLQLHLQTPSGESTVPSGRVGNVALGSAEAGDQEFLFTRFDDISTLPSDVRGILGQEFLAHFDYMLDFQHRRLTFGEPSATGMQTGFKLIYGRMAVSTNLGDLVLDSGAEILFLFRESTRAASALVMGATGASVAVSFETAPEVRIGDRRYRPTQAEYRPVPAAEEAGLLPANLFHAIFICNSKQYVVFDPLP
jgi:Aspartyl protease